MNHNQALAVRDYTAITRRTLAYTEAISAWEAKKP